jgi:hypothetical protein
VAFEAILLVNAEALSGSVRSRAVGGQQMWPDLKRPTGCIEADDDLLVVDLMDFAVPARNTPASAPRGVIRISRRFRFQAVTLFP